MPTEALDYLLALACSLGAAGDTNRALKVLDLAATTDSGAADALGVKAHALRSQGELRQAADLFALLGRRHPDHPHAPYLSALLAGANPPLPPARPAPWPSAFVRLENFLDHARHEQLLALVASQADALEPSTVGLIGPNGREPHVDLGSRTSFRLTAISSVSPWFRPLIRQCLPSTFDRLGIAPFEIGGIELKCTVYRDGSFFAAHSDNVSRPTRRISFVYYFHHLPKRYSGGALLLYDSDLADPAKYFADRITRLETLDNSLVLFPSSTFHEVTRVVSPANRFEDGRFTFAGHVHVVNEEASALGASRS